MGCIINGNLIITGITQTNSINENIDKSPNFTGESGHYSSYDYTKLNNYSTDNYYPNTILHDAYTSWVSTAEAGAYLEFESPQIVLIGDSIAEGHINKHSRLHTASSTVDLTQENTTGQISYELTEIFGANVVNQGIGGSNSTFTWSRWRRDVLAETYDVGDGRPTKTLNKKPYAVFIIIGINDISGSVSADITKTNMINMANSCKDNNMYCTFLTMMPDTPMNTTKQANTKTLNTWMINTLPKYGATVVDAYKWATNGSDSWVLRNDFAAWSDTIHPSEAGYHSLSRYIANNINLPLYLKGLSVEFTVSPSFSSFALPKNVTLSSGTFSKPIEFLGRSQSYIEDIVCRTYKQKITITDYMIANTYTGISGIKAILDYK